MSREELNELVKKFGMEIDNEDNWHDVEDTLKGYRKCATMDEFMKNGIEDINKTINGLEKYENKSYQCINCVDLQMGGQLGQAYLIVDKKFDYVDCIDTM